MAGVEIDVEYYEEGEQQETFSHRYEPAYREIHTITINGEDITGLINFIFSQGQLNVRPLNDILEEKL